MQAFKREKQPIVLANYDACEPQGLVWHKNLKDAVTA